MMRIADEKLAATSSSTITETVLRYYIHSLIPPLEITGDLALVTTHVPDFIKIEFTDHNLRPSVVELIAMSFVLHGYAM